MADIASLSVKLGLDSTSFTKSIQDVNRKLKIAQSEFKAASSGVDGFEDSVDGLRQKSDYLTKTLDLQRAKVETLRSRYEQLKEEKGETSKEAENMLIRLNKTISAMKKTEQQLGATNRQLEEQTDIWSRLRKKMDEVSDSFKAVGDKMKNAGQTLSQYVTLPFVGLGAAAIKTASDFDGAQAKIQGQLGLTAEEAEKLSDIAQEVWKKGFGESVEEVTGSLAILKQNMKDVAETDFQPLLQSAFTIQELFGADINETTAAAGVLMKQFGVDGQTAMDLITVGFQRGGNFSGELLDTLREYAPQFKGLGYNAEEFLSILIAGAESGAFNLDKVGDSAKEAFLRIGDGSTSSRDALKELGLDFNQIENDINSGGEKAQSAFMAVSSAIAGVEDPAERAQLAISLFGTPLEDLGPEFQTFFANVNTDLGEFEGATEKAGETLQKSFGEQVQQTFRELQSALEPIGKVLIDMIKKVSPVISTFAEWFGNLSPVIQQVIIIVGGLLAALGPLLIVFGAIASAIGTLMPVFVAVGGAIAAISAPVWIAIGAIAALIAIGVAVWKNWDTVREKAIEIWGAISSFLSSAWESIKTVSSNVWNGIKDFFVTWWDELLAAFGGPIGFLIQFVIKNWDTIKSNTMTVFNAVKSFFSTVWEGIKSVVSTVVDGIKSNISTNFNAIKSVVTTVWSGIKTAIIDPITTAKDKVLEIIGKIKSAFENLKIKIPKPKLPDIDVNWKKIGFGDLSVKIPTFDINWHKVGGVFTKPVVMGNAGFGDVEEAIVPFEGSHAKRIAGLIGKEMLPFMNPQQQGVNITIQSMNVRDDTDIHKIARELDGLIRSAGRGVIL